MATAASASAVAMRQFGGADAGVPAGEDSEDTPPCANPACSFAAHGAVEFAGFCCRKCRWAHEAGGGRAEHGPYCKRRPRRDVADAAPAADREDRQASACFADGAASGQTPSSSSSAPAPTAPAPMSPTPTPFDGRWLDEHGAKAVVSGGLLVADGAKIPILFEDGACSIEVGGVTRAGCLSDDGSELFWSDGAVWERLSAPSCGDSGHETTPASALRPTGVASVAPASGSITGSARAGRDVVGFRSGGSWDADAGDQAVASKPPAPLPSVSALETCAEAEIVAVAGPWRAAGKAPAGFRSGGSWDTGGVVPEASDPPPALGNYAVADDELEGGVVGGGAGILRQADDEIEGTAAVAAVSSAAIADAAAAAAAAATASLAIVPFAAASSSSGRAARAARGDRDPFASGERRLDPTYWDWVTYEELSERYAGSCSRSALRRYWELRCREEQRWDEDGAALTWREFREKHGAGRPDGPSEAQCRHRWRVLFWVEPEAPASAWDEDALSKLWDLGADDFEDEEAAEADEGVEADIEETLSPVVFDLVPVLNGRSTVEAGRDAVLAVLAGGGDSHASRARVPTEKPADPLQVTENWLAAWEGAAMDAGFS